MSRCHSNRIHRRKSSKTEQKNNEGDTPTNKLPSILKNPNDENLYPSSAWQTENQIHYRIIDFTGKTIRERPDYMVNKLDNRRHNPQSNQVYHIRCLNNKPICKVKSRTEDRQNMDEENDTIYSISYQHNKPSNKPMLIFRNMKENVAEGIVPFDQPQDNYDVREEMMLPICETTRIPSAPNPHKYLLRKRRIQAPVPPSGVFYPDEKLMLPHIEPEEPLPTSRVKTSISSLCGKDFTRRRFIQPPPGSFSVGHFDGGAQAIETHKFDDKYLPFVKAKTII